MGLFDGKKGVIFGIANDRSIAWPITQGPAPAGSRDRVSRISPTMIRNGRRTRTRSASSSSRSAAKFVIPCDVQKDDDLDQVVRADRAGVRQDRLRAAQHRVRAAGRPDRSGVQRQPRGLSTGDGHQRLLADRAGRPRAADHERRAAASSALTYLGGEKVIPGYNLMGLCKSALESATEYLASRDGQGRHPRRTRSAPARCGRSAPAASATSRRCWSCTRRSRRCGGTSRRRKSASPACSC